MYSDPRLKNKYHVWLGIYDFDCTPEQITEKLGLTPSRTRKKGEYRTVGKKNPHKILNKNNQWLLDSELDLNESVEKHIEFLLEKVRPNKQKFKEITKNYYVEFGCALYLYEANPGIHINNNLLKEISELNAKVDFDMYCLEGTTSQYKEPKAQQELSKLLSQYPFISQFDNAAENLADKLIKIDGARQDLGMDMEDLIVSEGLTEEEYKSKFNKVIGDLKVIIGSVQESKILSKILADI